MELRVVESLCELHALSNAWENLLDISNCHRAFSSPSWYFATLGSYPELKPHVVVVESDGELRGLAPFVINQNQLGFVSELADYQDIIVQDSHLDVSILMIQYVFEQAHLFSKIKLDGLREKSNFLLGINAIDPSDLDDVNVVGHQSCCFYTNLSNGYDAYLMTRSSNFRFNLRKAKRRANERGITIRELTQNDLTGHELVVTFLKLHLMRFPDKLFSRQAAQQFCLLNLPDQFEQKRLRVFALIDSREQGIEIVNSIVGLHLSVCDMNGLGIWNAGFDPAYSFISPGKLLINKQIEVCSEEGLDGFDFLRGDEAYKQSWSNSSQSLFSVTR